MLKSGGGAKISQTGSAAPRKILLPVPDNLY
jgi:hypothetical protein